MKRVRVQRQIDQLLAQQASEWYEVLQNGSESQRLEFVKWLKRSPLHVVEYLETVYTEQALKSIDGKPFGDIEELVAQISPTVIPIASPPANRALARAPKAWRVIGIAASVALIYMVSLPLVR